MKFVYHVYWGDLYFLLLTVTIGRGHVCRQYGTFDDSRQT